MHFSSTFYKMLQCFYQHFSKIFQRFFRNIGFVNYFLATFCKMLRHFLEMLDNIFLYV
jgi:hypothetical protein